MTIGVSCKENDTPLTHKNNLQQLRMCLFVLCALLVSRYPTLFIIFSNAWGNRSFRMHTVDPSKGHLFTYMLNWLYTYSSRKYSWNTAHITLNYNQSINHIKFQKRSTLKNKYFIINMNNIFISKPECYITGDKGLLSIKFSHIFLSKHVHGNYSGTDMAIFQ